MQTFVPLSSFAASADKLDIVRLRNQFYREGLTLIRGGWPNHPASKMWRGYESALALYLLACADELTERGFYYPQHIAEVMLFLPNGNRNADIELPPWIGDERVHSSHRANLLRKGIEDRTFKLYRSEGPRLKKHWDTEVYERIWRKHGQPESYWYGQFGWTETPTEGYYWPVN